MAKVGATSKYNKEMLDRIIECAKDGMSIEETCVELEITTETWYDWSDKDSERFKQEFSDTIKRHKELCHAWWLSEGRKSLRDPKFSFTGWYMNMKNRFGWKDKTENETTLKGNLSLTQILSKVDKEEAGE